MNARPWTLTAVLFILVGGCCCPDGTTTYPADHTGTPASPGRLHVETVPTAEIWIDGASAGLSPVDVQLAPGQTSAAVEVRLGGFEPERADVEVAGGDTTNVTYHLKASEADDREVLQLLASQHELWIEPLPEPTADRGEGDDKPVQLIYPRGQLTPTDLADFRIDFGSEAPKAGWVRFTKQGKPFFEHEYQTPETGVMIRSVPQDVQTNLKPGDQITWGFFPLKGEATTGTFEVVDKDVSAVIAAMKKGLSGQPEAAVVHLIAQVYTDAGLHYAAHRTAMNTIKSGKAALRPWAVVLSSLERMGAPKAARAFGEARKQVAAFSALQGREVFFRPDYPVQRVLEHMDAGDAGRALLSLRSETLSSIAQSPLQADAVARRAAAQSRFLAVRSPAATRRVAEAVVTIAKEAHAQAPDDPQTSSALGYALLHQARVRKALDDKVSADAWRAAAEALLVAYDVGLDDEGEALVRAIGWLREAAAQRGAKVKDLDAACDALATRCEKQFPKSPYSAAARASALVGRAAHASRSNARKHLREAFAALEAPLKDATPKPILLDLHAQAVTLDRTDRLGLKAAYRTERQDTLDFLATFDVPDTPRWQVMSPPPEGYLARVEQYGTDGDLLRVITIRSTAAGMGYLFPSGLSVDGDNVGRLARADLEEASRGYRRVKGRPRAVKKRFSKAFASGYAYDVQGKGPDGSYRRTRSWFAKSRIRKVTFLITIAEFAERDGATPELDVFIDSLQETQRKSR